MSQRPVQHVKQGDVLSVFSGAANTNLPDTRLVWELVWELETGPSHSAHFALPENGSVFLFVYAQVQHNKIITLCHEYHFIMAKKSFVVAVCVKG